MRRRVVLLASIGLAACGGSGGDTAGPAAVSPDVWRIDRLDLLQGSSFSLATTLPPGIAAGGIFSIAAGSSPLPAGVTLSSAGVLTVSSTATASSINGIVFAYDSP